MAVLYADPAAGLDRLVAVIERYWALTLAPYWARIRTLLDGDVLVRARRLAEHGAARLFADLDPNVTWDTDTLSVRHRHASGQRGLMGRGLLLVPPVFVWPRVFSKIDPAWQPTLRYPPRGIGTLLEPAGGRPTGGAGRGARPVQGCAAGRAGGAGVND